jgi:hypothetical protein
MLTNSLRRATSSSRPCPSQPSQLDPLPVHLRTRNLAFLRDLRPQWFVIAQRVSKHTSSTPALNIAYGAD